MCAPHRARVAFTTDAARESELQPGGRSRSRRCRIRTTAPPTTSTEGQRLYKWYNCSGCHANGGGGMGPPLIKDKGSGSTAVSRRNIFDTIVKGRPNGMPTWGGTHPRVSDLADRRVRAVDESGAAEIGDSAAAATPIEQKSNNIKNKVPGVTK